MFGIPALSLSRSSGINYFKDFVSHEKLKYSELKPDLGLVKSFSLDAGEDFSVFADEVPPDLLIKNPKEYLRYLCLGRVSQIDGSKPIFENQFQACYRYLFTKEFSTTKACFYTDEISTCIAAADQMDICVNYPKKNSYDSTTAVATDHTNYGFDITIEYAQADGASTMYLSSAPTLSDVKPIIRELSGCTHDFLKTSRYLSTNSVRLKKYVTEGHTADEVECVQRQSEYPVFYSLHINQSYYDQMLSAHMSYKEKHPDFTLDELVDMNNHESYTYQATSVTAPFFIICSDFKDERNDTLYQYKIGEDTQHMQIDRLLLKSDEYNIYSKLNFYQTTQISHSRVKKIHINHVDIGETIYSFSNLKYQS